eukprot:scaffold592355_cov11-Prasinocladus_malaysianus.AAC.1
MADLTGGGEIATRRTTARARLVFSRESGTFGRGVLARPSNCKDYSYESRQLVSRLNATSPPIPSQYFRDSATEPEGVGCWIRCKSDDGPAPTSSASRTTSTTSAFNGKAHK